MRAVEDAHQTRWSGEARVWRHHRTADPSHRPCDAQGACSQGTGTDQLIVGRNVTLTLN
jgi:hypothetical protein